MDNNIAPLVIDVQVGMFPENDPVHNAGVLIENIKTLIGKARSVGTPIIYVQHNAGPGKPLEPGASGWEFYPAIRPNVGDTVIQKTTPDSFHETNLQRELLDRGIKKLILTGIQTEFTCRHHACESTPSSFGRLAWILSSTKTISDAQTLFDSLHSLCRYRWRRKWRSREIEKTS